MINMLSSSSSIINSKFSSSFFMASFQFILGVIVASLFCYCLTIGHAELRRKKKVKASPINEKKVKASEETVVEKKDDIIIVGAGVAGSALAYALAKDGRRVHVFERDLSQPDKIVGEVLQPGGYLKLVELGLEDCVNGIDAQKLFGYIFFVDGKITHVTYPLENLDPVVTGRAFHHGRFVQRLREKAASLPNVRLEQGTVTSLLKENGIVKGVRFKKDGEEETAYAPLTIVCDGASSTLRRSLCISKVHIPSSAVGLILENCKLPKPNHGFFVLGEPSVVGFYPISSSEIRCLVDVPGQKVPSISSGAMAHFLKTKIAPQIPSDLRPAFTTAIDKGNVRAMQNRTISAVTGSTPGAMLMGDALNARHSSTAGGMTVALCDVVMLRNLLRPLGNLNNVPALCKYLESFYVLRKPMASVVNSGATVLYESYTRLPKPVLKVFRRVVMDYLMLGSRTSLVDGPIAGLACLNPYPWIMLFYFIPFGIYVVSRLLLPFPSPRRVYNTATCVLVGLGILVPLMKSEGLRETLFPITTAAYYRARLMGYKS